VVQIFDSQNRLIAIEYKDERGNNMTVPSSYSSCRYSYDKRGNIKETIYLDENGNEMIVEGLGYSQVYDEYNEKSQLVVREYRTSVAGYAVGSEGTAILSKDGYSREEIDYDKWGNEKSHSYFDNRSGYNNLINTHSGYAKKVAKYNGIQLMEEEYFDQNGNPSNQSNYDKTHKITYQYDPFSNTSRIEKFDINGILLNTIERDYNSLGNLLSELRYNQNPETSDLVFGELVKYEYDNLGNQTLIYYCDESGDIVERDGYYYKETLYDEKSRATDVSTLDVKRIPIVPAYYYSYATKHTEGEFYGTTILSYFGNEYVSMLNSGYHHDKTERNMSGKITSIAYFDASDNNIEFTDIIYQDGQEIKKRGFAKVEVEYDNQGNLTKVQYLDSAGKPSSAPSAFRRKYGVYLQNVPIEYSEPDEYSYAVIAYDRFDRIERMSFYGNRDSFIECVAFGYHYLSGELSSISYYDNSGDKIKSLKTGYHEMRISTYGYDHDEDELFEETQKLIYLYDEIDGQVCPNGYSLEWHLFDEYGREYRISYWKGSATDGGYIAVLNTTLGYSQIKKEYDSLGNLLSEHYYDEDDAPVNNANGVAYIIYEIDGNCIGYDEYGKLVFTGYSAR
jgi:hypothetical protein